MSDSAPDKFSFEGAASAGTATASAAAVAAAVQAIKDGPLQVLDSQLAALYLNQGQNAKLLAPLTETMQSFSGAIDAAAGLVTIDATAKDSDGATLVAQWQNIGLIDGGSFGSMASGLLPVSQIPALLQLGDLSFARESGYSS